jgi:hypothetical protein
VQLVPNNLNTLDTLFNFIPGLDVNWPEFLSTTAFVHDHMESETLISIRDPNAKGKVVDKVAPQETEALMTLEITRSHLVISH